VAAVGGVVVVVVGCCDGTAGALVLADRPVLKIIVATVDQAVLVVAAVAVNGALVRARRAGVVGAVVLENLSKG
jgi:hypothetical protein